MSNTTTTHTISKFHLIVCQDSFVSRTIDALETELAKFLIDSEEITTASDMKKTATVRLEDLTEEQRDYCNADGWEIEIDQTAIIHFYNEFYHIVEVQTPSKLKTVLPAKITTQEEANAFFLELSKNGESFHFDDDPADVINAGTGAPLFTPAEAEHIAELMNDVDAVCSNLPGGLWDLPAISMILNSCR